ncbi:STAS domain-containing protein [Streptomyces sp. NPDC055060]
MNDPHGGHATRPRPAPSSTQLTVCPLPDRAGVKVAGEVSLPTRPDWERTLERVVGQSRGPYYLELSELTFIDMAGATSLAVTAQRLNGDQRFVLGSPPPTLARLPELFWTNLPTIEVDAS